MAELCAAAQHGRKWQGIMPCLRLARAALGLNRSRLELLEKLMACVPGETLRTGAGGRLIVHASNSRLAAMTNRECEKTITRLITELVERGLLERHASPNGKRFCRRGPQGDVVAYGLDIGPLLRALPRIARLATEAAAEQELCQRLREECSLLLSALPGTDTELMTNAKLILRRKPCRRELEDLRIALQSAQPQDKPECHRKNPKTEKMGPCDPQKVRHKDSSHKKDIVTPGVCPNLVAQAMPRVANLGRQMNTNLRSLVDHLRRALAISERSWRIALERLGFDEAALLAMALYERQSRYRNPPAYFATVVYNAQSDSMPGRDHLNKLLKGASGLRP